jgi:DNA-binding MarR family transcriptional regulator
LGMPEQTPIGEPSELLGYLLKQAHLRLTAVADDALAGVGVERKEFALLRALASGDELSQQALATRLRIDQTTMVAVVDALEERGLVTRTPDPSDRRRNLIGLTAAGRRSLRDADSVYIAAESEFLAPLSGSEAASLRRTLRTLLGM